MGRSILIGLFIKHNHRHHQGVKILRGIYFASDQYIAMLHASIGTGLLVLDTGIARGKYYCSVWF